MWEHVLLTVVKYNIKKPPGLYYNVILYSGIKIPIQRCTSSVIKVKLTSTENRKNQTFRVPLLQSRGSVGTTTDY
jgi:hypothetical protein